MNTRFRDKCPKKRLTFSGVGALISSWGSNPSTTGNTASVAKPSTNGNDSDSDMGDIVGNVNKMKNTYGSNNTGFGYAEEMIADFSTRPALTEENFPYWRSNDRNANKRTKTCPICMKGRLTWEQL